MHFVRKGGDSLVSKPQAEAKKRGAPVGHAGWFRPTPTRIDRTIYVSAPACCPHCDAAVRAWPNLPPYGHVQEDRAMYARCYSLPTKRERRDVIQSLSRRRMPQMYSASHAADITAVWKLNCYTPLPPPPLPTRGCFGEGYQSDRHSASPGGDRTAQPADLQVDARFRGGFRAGIPNSGILNSAPNSCDTSEKRHELMGR